MKTLAIAREDLRMTLRDRSSIFWIFIAPFLWVFFFGFIARSQPAPDARVALTVLDEDDSEAAAKFITLLAAENFIVTEVKSAAEIPAGDDEPARVVTIPAGFGESLAQRRKVALPFRTRRNANQEATLAAQVSLHKASVRMLAGEAFGGLPAVGDAVTVRTSWGTGREVPTGYYQTIPGNLVMFVMLSTMSYGAALLAMERKQGLLKRLASTSVTRPQIILGKMLGRAGVAIVQTGVFLLIGLAVFRIDWGDSPLGLALLLLSWVLAAATFGLLAGALFASPDSAAGIGVVLTLLMSAMGGCWWPAEVMPQWLRTAALAFPTSWAMGGLNEIISWEGGLRDVTLNIVVLLGFAIAAGTLASRRLRIVES